MNASFYGASNDTTESNHLEIVKLLTINAFVALNQIFASFLGSEEVGTRNFVRGHRIGYFERIPDILITCHIFGANNPQANNEFILPTLHHAYV